jgi:predicted HicB family RNase H-like nuclease
MEYKGYIGKAELDDESGVLHGDVINVRDVITFEAQTVAVFSRHFGIR